MFRFNRALSRRVEELARKWASIPEPVSPEEKARRDARREELIAASLEGRRPVPDLRDRDEAQRFEKMREYASVFREMIDEGILDAETGQPVGPPAPDHDDQGDEEPRTRP